MDVAKALGASGTQARVVSMPCWELFEKQDEGYQLQGTGTLLTLLLFCVLSSSLLHGVFFRAPQRSAQVKATHVSEMIRYFANLK